MTIVGYQQKKTKKEEKKKLYLCNEYAKGKRKCNEVTTTTITTTKKNLHTHKNSLIAYCIYIWSFVNFNNIVQQLNGDISVNDTI